MPPHSFFYFFFAPVVSDLSDRAYFEWKAHDGRVCDVQFGSTDETKVYSLGEDKMFCLWSTSTTSAPLKEIHFDDYQPPPRLTRIERYYIIRNIRISHPAIGRNKLFGFAFAYKYIMISSVEGKALYEVKCNKNCLNIFITIIHFIISPKFSFSTIFIINGF